MDILLALWFVAAAWAVHVFTILRPHSSPWARAVSLVSSFVLGWYFLTWLPVTHALSLTEWTGAAQMGPVTMLAMAAGVWLILEAWGPKTHASDATQRD